MLLARQFFNVFFVRSSSPYCLAHFLPTSSSKSAPSPTGFLRFLCVIELSLQSRALFADLIIFQKCSWPDSFLRFFREIELRLQSRALFADLIFQKCSELDSFFYVFFVRSSSPYSLAHFLPTSSSKSAPSPAIFYDFLWDQIELSLQSRAISCTSCRPHLPKVLLTRQFFTISLWDRALATVSCTFCRPHLPKVLLDQQSFYNFCVRSSSSYVSCTFWRPHLPKVLLARQVFYDFYVRSSSPYSLVHFLPTSSCKSAPSPTVFYDFLVRSSSPCSLVHFLPTSSSKSSPSPAIFYDFYVRSSKSAPGLTVFYVFSWDRDLATVSCAFCRPHLPKVLLARQFFMIFMWDLPKALLARQFFTFFSWDRALATVSCTFCRPHLPEVLLAHEFFTIFVWDRALATVSCIFANLIFLPTSSSKSAPSPTALFYDFFVRCCEIELSLCLVHFLPTSPCKSSPSPTVFHDFLWDLALPTVSCTFCRPHLPKVLLARHFFTIFLWDRALPTVSCNFCQPHLPKVLLARQVFYDFYVWSSSPYLLPTSSQTCSGLDCFLRFFLWDRALGTVSCTFCRPHLPKVLLARQFFTIFMWDRALSM